MPINSFDNYPMTWRPARAELHPPFYRALAAQLEYDILSGRLLPHTKLPPQRELADFLDLNLSTVTRAFRLCTDKGLIYAVIGRGTFVSPNAVLHDTMGGTEKSIIELGSIHPYEEFNEILADTAREILRGKDAARLFALGGVQDEDRHARTACSWLAHFSLAAEPANLLLTSGTQSALAIVLTALFDAGDRIAVDGYTYANFIGLAKQLNIRLIPIEGDGDGMLPDALARQRQQINIKGVYLMPSCANPTGIIMPEERRKKIAAVLRKHNMLLIEDDAYGFTVRENAVPMTMLLPRQSVYLHSLSKLTCPGLRVAYMLVPAHLRPLFRRTVRSISMTIPPLSAEIASELIASGAAERIMREKCRMSEERNRIFRGIFPAQTRNPRSFFQWMPLPVGCGGANFEAQAQHRGVRVLSSDRFAVGGEAEHSFIRLALCSPPTNEELARGLRIVHDLMEENTIPPQTETLIL